MYIVAPYKQIAVIYLTSNELVKRDLEVFNKSNYKFKHVVVTNEVIFQLSQSIDMSRSQTVL